MRGLTLRDQTMLRVGSLSYSATVLSDSPLAYWRLEETSGTNVVDSSGNGFDATLGAGAAAPTINQTGKVDKCYLFDDANSQQAGYPSNTLFTALNGTSFTVEAWVKADAAKANNAIVGNDNNDASVSQRSWVLGLNASRQIEFFKIPNGLVQLTGVTALTLNTWYHVAVTYDGANLKAYVNGVLDQTAAATGSLKGTGVVQFVYIGYQGRPGTTFFSGNIDEVALYTSPLSAARLLAHFNAA